MKKTVLLLILACIVLCFTVSCRPELENDTNDKRLDGATAGGVEEEPIHETDTDMTAFLSKLVVADAAQLNMASKTLEMTQVPTLHSPDFQFRMVENLKHYFIYTYIPITGDVTSNLIKHDEIFTVYVAKSDRTYQAALEQEDVADQDGCVYLEKKNEWLFNYDGKCVSIVCPANIVLTSPEQIADYFTFETYYYTVPADSGAVTE